MRVTKKGFHITKFPRDATNAIFAIKVTDPAKRQACQDWILQCAEAGPEILRVHSYFTFEQQIQQNRTFRVLLRLEPPFCGHFSDDLVWRPWRSENGKVFRAAIDACFRSIPDYVTRLAVTNLSNNDYQVHIGDMFRTSTTFHRMSEINRSVIA